jgi:hypothetical protein
LRGFAAFNLGNSSVTTRQIIGSEALRIRAAARFQCRGPEAMEFPAAYTNGVEF